VKIAVVGGGLAGLCAAHGLLERGVGEITVFENRAGPGLETSHANGALLHPSAVDPWNSPGILRYLLANLGNPRSPVLLRPRALPSLLGWGLRFVRESSPERHRAHTRANVALALHSVMRMQALRDAGLEYGAAQRGSLTLQREAASFAQGREHAAWLEAQGVPSRSLSRDELVALEPALVPIAHTLVGGLHHTGDECGDAYRFCQAMAARLAARGVVFRWSTAVQALRADGGVVRGVRLADGQELAFDAVVLAAAAWSVALAAPLGLRLPVRPVKGYSVTLPVPADDSAGAVDASPFAADMTRLPRAPLAPTTPLGDHDLHIAVVPVVGGRLRVAGTAEFCGEDRRIDPARVGNLLRPLVQIFPALAEHVAHAPRQEWTGLRPMCADGKPLIGRTRLRGLFLNTGHGQIGWTTAVASGELLAAAVTGREAPIDATPFLPARFGL